MRGAVLLVVAACASLAACSTDMSGLGGELLVDASSGDTTVSGEDDTAPLFPDEDSGAPIDTLIADSAPPDTAAPDDAGVDTEADAGATDSESGTDATGADVDDTGIDASGPDTLADAAGDAAPDAVDDTAADTIAPVDTGLDAGGPVATTPGKVSCHQSGAAKLCDTNFCCGAWTFSGISWQCSDNCGLFGVGALDYACDEKADCDSGKVCCVKIAAIGGGWDGSDCRSSCGSDPQLCAFTAECPAGKTCQAVKPPSAPFTYGQCK
ncbi:MAG: hypothetical protein HYV09_29615 [Deltaproteobacteria bacterium]|nr:hypothetical protein [Deltaproteobacteria bacterium]